MVSIVSTVAYLGLEARSVEVQCQIAPGMVGFAVVGLPDKAVAESRERVDVAFSRECHEAGIAAGCRCIDRD